MRSKILPLLIAFYLLYWRPVASAAELSLSLDNPPTSGQVIFELYDSADRFGDLRDPVMVVARPLDGRETYRLSDIAAGRYALMAYHDVNGNGRIDKNFIGIPREPLAFSNAYAPKGPPSYKRAAFLISEGETLHFDLRLYRPLGDAGRLGVGLGVIARSSPYRDYDGNVYRLIPAISYNSERLQIYGPTLRYGLIGSGDLRLAASASYRIGVYEEDQSPMLAGMGDREDTLMAGLALQAELPGGFELGLSLEHDILDQIGGNNLRLSIKRSFQAGIVRLTPEIALNRLSSELAQHDFGVPVDKATPFRPAYELDEAINLEVGLGVFIELSRDWLVILNASVERLDDQVTDSPIVDEDTLVKGFAAINYVF